ncbi:Plasmid maintenance system antidote protein [Bacteroidales bacterium Barb6]|nr:Plasmid maintenance system antidote protein [Bacteroidales bacterium Barb6]OAV73540.1 Plasmid maintenance system antidote protein [Bacteroidales bacterium Barb6]
MKTDYSQKADVIDPLSLFNTVGEEVENIAEEQQKDKQELLRLLNWTSFASAKKINSRDLTLIKEFLQMGTEADSFFINFQSNYSNTEKKAKEAYKKSKANFKKLRSAILVMGSEFTSGMDKLEDITDFWGVDSEEQIFEQSDSFAALFRQQNNATVNSVNLGAWLRRGEIDFKKRNVPEYDEGGLKSWIEKKEWRKHITDVPYFLSLPDTLLKFGVALIYVPFLRNTVYGAVRWFGGNPLVQVSDRNKDLAGCWFTLFHELGHVVLHKNDNVFEGEINETKSKASQKEKDANKFANQYLFNGDGLRKDAFSVKKNGLFVDAEMLADKYDVNPIFASYWFKKAQYHPATQKSIHIEFV